MKIFLNRKSKKIHILKACEKLVRESYPSYLKFFRVMTGNNLNQLFLDEFRGSLNLMGFPESNGKTFKHGFYRASLRSASVLTLGIPRENHHFGNRLCRN